MANRKIKHIIAKLVGASTEETLDVYDVDAVHTDKIYNGLDQTSAGYVLDARQGKALNDSLAWKSLPLITGAGSTISLPTSWAEANIRVSLDGNRFFLFHILSINFNFGTATAYNLRNGYYQNTGNNAYVSITVTTSTNSSATVQLVDAFLTGTDKASTTSVQIRYR